MKWMRWFRRKKREDEIQRDPRADLVTLSGRQYDLIQQEIRDLNDKILEKAKIPHYCSACQARLRYGLFLCDLQLDEVYCEVCAKAVLKLSRQPAVKPPEHAVVKAQRHKLDEEA